MVLVSRLLTQFLFVAEPPTNEWIMLRKVTANSPIQAIDPYSPSCKQRDGHGSHNKKRFALGWPLWLPIVWQFLVYYRSLWIMEFRHSSLPLRHGLCFDLNFVYCFRPFFLDGIPSQLSVPHFAVIESGRESIRQAETGA